MSSSIDDKTILLVEDNPDDVDLTLRAFDRNGFKNRIIVAQDGVEALDRLAIACATQDDEPGNLPSVVLLDLKLPKIDGLEVLRRLRANKRTALIPVVILTSSNDSKDIIASYELGANSYLRKPVDFSEFNDAVKQLGFYWLAMNITSPSWC